MFCWKSKIDESDVDYGEDESDESDDSNGDEGDDESDSDEGAEECEIGADSESKKTSMDNSIS